MGGKLTHFIKYNNALPIGISFLLLSFSGALAASPEVRQEVAGLVVTEEQTVKTVDNSYILNVDLSVYAPKIVITNVTEDADKYYVSYTLSTIDIKDYVWQSIDEPKTLEVAKDALGSGDLGLYVTRQLQEVSDWQMAYLKRVQDIEKKNGLQQKVVATAYSGLIGKFLDPKEEALPGYVPVVEEPKEGGTGNSSGTKDTDTVAPYDVANADGSVSTIAGTTDRIPPELQILGKNPAQIAVGSTYVDLGAVVTDNVTTNLGYETKGAKAVDTSAPGEFSITYTATDEQGNKTVAVRKVIVYDPAVGPSVPESEVKNNEPAGTDAATPEPSATSTNPTGGGEPAATTTPETSAGTETASSTPATETTPEPAATSTPATTTPSTTPPPAETSATTTPAAPQGAETVPSTSTTTDTTPTP